MSGVDFSDESVEAAYNFTVRAMADEITAMSRRLIDLKTEHSRIDKASWYKSYVIAMANEYVARMTEDEKRSWLLNEKARRFERYDELTDS